MVPCSSDNYQPMSSSLVVQLWTSDSSFIVRFFLSQPLVFFTWPGNVPDQPNTGSSGTVIWDVAVPECPFFPCALSGVRKI
ncbi:predicted protein [Chaetoceros tenuissimus]|uniref:Uncharacterized protein n=1 Tax=Chaetoceros tenuissimus TaxID=426638 RepID=A0AAD3H9S3_9STRA|nr:predicted protein [Chaetoceros tenuissimus]